MYNYGFRHWSIIILILIIPCSVAVDGTGNSFQFYTSGVYCSSQCSSKKLNHALLLAGYGTTIDGQDYWILKNRYFLGSYTNQ